MTLNKEGLPKLYKFQNQDLKKWYYTMNRRGILDWEVGTGKGFVGARVVRGYVKDSKSVLILTSNALIPDWVENVEEHNIPIKNLMKKTKKELSKKADVYICSYDSLKNHTYLKPDLIIGDECFVSGTLVDTPKGKVPIEKISVGDKILNALGIDEVVHVFKGNTSQTIKINNVECTLNHPFFTIKGWTLAKDLEVNDEIITRRSGMQLLWEGVNKKANLFSQLSKKEIGNSWGKTRSFLQSQLCGEIEQRYKESVCFRMAQEKQLYVQKRSTREGFKKAERNRSQACKARREWKGINKTRTNAFRSTTRSMGRELCRSHGCSQKEKSSLQNRLSSSRIKNSHRSRWIFPLLFKKERTRPMEGKSIETIRVESVQIQKQGSRNTYNLQVKNHPSYSVNDMLVHNCHKCKAYGSSRGKVFRKMAQEADDLLMMSGTLWQHSDAVELLNYLWCLNTPEVLYKIPQNITRFREEYCSMITGANNMRWYVTNKRGAELVEDVIKKHILTRETRKELEIPELIEQKISVESEYSFKEMTKKLSEEMDMVIDSSYEKPHITHALMLANGMDFETRELKKDDKIKTVMELLSNIPEDKQVILWYYWKDYKNFLAYALDKAGISYDIASGGMTPEKKKDVTDRFREGGFRVLVASQGTLAEGFNLQNANYSIFVNIWYDYIKYAQAIGRIERNGQKNKMVNYMLVGKGSMEEEAYKVLKKKMTLDEAKDFLHGVMMKKLGGKR